MIMRDRNFFINACSMKLIHGQEPPELHKKNKKKDARFNPIGGLNGGKQARGLREGQNEQKQTMKVPGK